MINDLKKLKLIDSIIFYLIILLPLTLVSGPFLSDLSVSIIALLFIYISIKEKLYFYYNNKYTKIFFSFFIVLIISSIFSKDVMISLKKVIFFFRFWIFSLAVWYLLSLYENKLIKYLIFTFTSTFLFLIFDGYIQFFFSENIFGWPVQGSRVSSLFKDELILGSYLSRLLPVYFALLVYSNFSKTFNKYFLFFIIFVGIETLTFLSGERVAFFYINASSLMLIILMKNYKIFRFSSIITSILIIIVLINYFPKSTDRIIKQTINQLGLSSETKNQTLSNNKNDQTNILLNKIKINAFSIEHQNHYISSIKMFRDNIITGVGPRMFRNLCGSKEYYLWEGCSTHSHNTYIQLLAETGLIGFIFAFVIFLLIFKSILVHFYAKFVKKKYIYSDFQLCLISAFLISIWPFVPTGDFFNNWLNIIYFFPVGFYLNSLDKFKK